MVHCFFPASCTRMISLPYKSRKCRKVASGVFTGRRGHMQVPLSVCGGIIQLMEARFAFIKSSSLIVVVDQYYYPAKCIFHMRGDLGTINTFFAAELRIITGLLNN